MPGARAVERRIVTVLFADLVGFTSLSERLDPEDVALVQDAYFDAVRETVARHGGQLEKFIGDAAMAVFGAPRTRDDDAERAVRAGLALVAAVERLASTLGLDDGALRLRVGVNSGETLYGEASAERGPVTGDVVNVAARLQAAAEPGTVIVGEVTALAVADAISLEPLPPLALKGKAETVTAFGVRGLHPERSRERALGRLRAPTLGRERELELLAGALGDGARRILVAAPPGVGKSRLVSELAATARDRGATVLEARVRPDTLGPYEPVGQLVRAAGGERADAVLSGAALPTGRGEALAGALDALRDPGGGAADDRRERDALFEAWIEILELLAGGRPSLWVVEDAHWASPDLLAFLEAARKATSASGRLVVVTSRPDLLETAPAWCALGELLELGPLPERSTGDLVRALVGAALPDELVERVVERAGGNPLFVEELLRMWAGAGVLRHDAERGWSLSAEPEDVHLPPTVHAVYAGQLDDLPPAARTAARRFAVAGRRFPGAAAEPLEVADSEQALESLALRALVAGPHADELLGPSFAFRHALLRDAGYASLAKAERAVLHCKLAQWLAALPGDAPARLAEVIGRHYGAALESAPRLLADVAGRSRADIAAAAGEWFERAAGQAVRLAAWESARLLALRALEHADDNRPLERARRLQLLAEATANAVGADEAITMLEEAIDAFRAGASEDPDAARAGIASAGHGLGELLRAQTWFVRARDLADDLLAEIGEEADPVSRARLLVLRSLAVLNAFDDARAARSDAEQALELARSAGDAGVELDAEQVLAEIDSEHVPLDDALASWRRIEELGRRTGRWSSAAMALRAQAGLCVDEEPAEALRLGGRCLELSEARGLVEPAAWSRQVRAEAWFLLGEWDAAIEAGLAAVEAGERHGFHRVVVRSWFVLLPIARARGNDSLVREAHGCFAARKGREPDSPYARIVTTAAHLDFAAAGLEPAFVPDVGERLASFDGVHSGPSWLAAVERIVGAWLDAGELDGASAALDRMSACLAESTSLAHATEATLRARLSLARDNRDAAGSFARRALEALGRDAPWWRLGALRALAAAEGGDGRRGEIAALEARLGLPSA